MTIPGWIAWRACYAADDDGNGGDDKGDKSGSIMDLADKDAAAAAADDDKGDKGDGDGDDGKAKPYDPGSLPDGILGETDQATIDNLVGTLKSARQAISKGKHKTPDVPDDAAGYEITSTGDDDAIALAMNGEEAGDVMGVARDAALDAGLGKEQFEKFVRAFMEKGGDVGMLMSDEDAIKISAGEEMKELITTVGSEQGAKQIVNTVSAYFDKLKAVEIVSEADREEWNTMVGTARASEMMYRVLTEIAGFKPVPLEGARGDETYTHVEAQALQAKALRMEPGAERTAEIVRVQKIFEQVYGTEPAADSRTATARAIA